MEGAVILKGFGLLFAGLLFVWLGIIGWKHRREERINIIEAAILKISNEEPLPRSLFDRAMAYLQPILMLVFGPAMILTGLVLLFV
ncbi:hypothetical protein [Allopontixanthobacter sediminis]|uniref:Uncharacterized protein n=1 Tax=Allopontixanthobacter sediminis TaxID=1689985 RepID=A0A845AYE2_9SPHN|nr:hypothetical protein [Allopontixanthobacter sediminis]MXP44021.1 hypothetical protein [Allopontixanthobacter sediminis]